MPLIEGCSEKALRENIAKLKDEGYSEDQAYMIALETAYDNRSKCSEKRREEIEEIWEEAQ